MIFYTTDRKRQRNIFGKVLGKENEENYIHCLFQLFCFLKTLQGHFIVGKTDIRNQNFMTIIVLKTKKANRIGWMIIKKMQLITFFHSIVKHRASEIICSSKICLVIVEPNCNNLLDRRQKCQH